MIMNFTQIVSILYMYGVIALLMKLRASTKCVGPEVNISPDTNNRIPKRLTDVTHETPHNNAALPTIHPNIIIRHSPNMWLAKVTKSAVMIDI